MNSADSPPAAIPKPPLSVVKRALIAIVVVLDALVLIDLAGSVFAAAIFIVFVAAVLVPAGLLVLRLPHIRTMPPDLRITAAGALVVMLIAPWFFVRKVLPFVPAFVDIAASVILIGAASRFGNVRATFEELRPAIQRSRLFALIVLPILFAMAWLGYGAPSGSDVLFHGLFAIDFGNLVSVVATLRASPLLPLAAVTGGGPVNYHWLYFTLPATLTDFCGVAIPAFNALILSNLLMAMLLVHTLRTAVTAFYPEAGRRTTALTVGVTLFAPFSLYYYQIVAARFHLGWLAMPTRNHLILAPVNSMIVFGNNTVALVLVLFTAMQVERWNRERRVADLILGTVALSMVIGYSVTLLFPLAGALLLWLAMGRIARPVVVLTAAVVSGGVAVAMFFAIHVLGSGGARHAAAAFDGGQFLRLTLLGMLPLWVIFFMSLRKPLNFFHALIVAAIAVPSLLFVAGSPTGQIDFSMKTGSLIAIAFAPLIAPTIETWLRGGLRRWQAIVAALVLTAGAIQTGAYILQFPYYRLTGSRSRAVALSRDYYGALLWLRDHTPQRSIVVDPGGLTMGEVLPTLWIAERRVWLPTANTEAFGSPSSDSVMRQRAALWETFAHDPGNGSAAGTIAREADYLMVPHELRSAFWSPASRFGEWMIYRSAARSALPR